MPTRFFFYPLIIGTVLMLSCYESDPLLLENDKLLAGTGSFGKTYFISDIEIELGNLIINECIGDNFITYYPDGSYEFTEGATKCDPSDPIGYEGIWSFSRSETILYIESPDSLQSWVIESLDENHHRITSEFSEGSRTYTLSLY